MTPRAGVPVQERGHISLIDKMHYFFKQFLLFSQTYIRLSESMVVMTKGESTKIVKCYLVTP